MRSHQPAPGLRPEAQILLSCAGMAEQSAKTARIQKLAAQDIDWIELLRLTVENRLVPQLHRQLQALAPGSVPESFAKRLEIMFNTVKLQNIKLMEEMLGLLKLFEAEGIRALPYKGPMLASTIYGDLAMRQTRDLDILVSPEDVLKTKDLLLKRGYDPEVELDAEDEKDLINHDCEYNFLKRDSHILIEIHWRILPPKHADGFAFEQVWDNIERIPLCGSSVPTLEPETLFLILCLHAGQKHQWSRMRWICDIALFVRDHWDMDWERTLRRAEQLDLTGFVGLGLYLANALLKAEIPPAALPLVKNSPKLAGLAGLVRGRLFREGSGLPGFEEWRDYLCEHGAIRSPERRLLPHLFHFLLYGWSVMHPEWQDRDPLPTLPKLLSFLHYLVRTVRLFRKHQLSLAKRLA